MTAEENHNVAQLLADVAATQPAKPALVFRNRNVEQEITFGDLWQRASSFGAGLRRCGFQPGQRAIIMIPMSVDLYVALLGIIKIGGVAVFVDPWIAARQIARFSVFSEPTAYIGIGKSHLLRLFHRRLRRIPISVSNGRRLLGLPARHAFKRLLDTEPDPAVHPVEPGDSALITFTSGSSGEPKGANRTHRFLAAQHNALAIEFPYVDTDVDMPMFPVFALNNLVTGITSVVPEMDFKNVAAVDGSRIANQIVKHRVTTMTASPPLIDRLAGTDRASFPTFPLRRILTGGAPVTDHQLASWTNRFSDTEILVAYGSTEAEPVGHIEANERMQTSTVGKGYCTGIPTDQIQARTIPITKGRVNFAHRTLDSIALASGQIGELVVSGDHVCRDYFRNQLATQENKLIEPDGTLWHRMGDTGYFDDQGRFWLVGRVHSSIRRGRDWIHPQLVEQVAYAFAPHGSKVAAVGTPDPTLGEKVTVLVETSAVVHSPGQADDLIKNLKRSFAEKQMVVDHILITNTALPLDPRHQSKIDYSKTKQLLESGKFRLIAGNP